MFDAGAIQAHLDVDTRLFDSKMDAAEARVKKFEDDGHKVKISAVFDNASMGRARQMFTSLDQQLSRDAMARLRSSPQGSVLGALNALFSPHPVTGAPSPQQAASSGLLGRIVAAPGGGLPGNQNSISQLLLGQAAGGGTRGGPAHVTIDNLTDLANAVNGPGTPNVTPPDPNAAGNAANTANIKQATQSANAAAQNSARAASSASQAASSASQAAQTNANSNRSLVSRLSGLFGGGGGGGGGALGGFLGGGAGARSAIAGTLGGIGPGILGVGAKTAGIVGVGGAVLGAVPGLIGGLSPLLAAAPGLAGIAALAKGSLSNVSPLTQLQSQIQNEQTAGLGATKQGAQQLQQQQQQLAAGVAALPAAQQSMYNSIVGIQNAWQNLTASFAPLMAKALGQVAALFQQLLPQLNSFFAASGGLLQPLIGGLGDLARQWLPLFTAGIKAATPVIRPLLDGIGALVTGLLPGLITLVKASAPAVTTLGQVFGTLGQDLGKMLAVFAPVLVQSDVLFKALFDLIGALLPIIGELAGIFAKALAPVFLQFSGVVQSLLPFLTLIGKVLGALAQAVLADLVSAFTALAQLLIGIAPALGAFAKAFSQVFTVLENSGVFAIIGNAIEALVTPLTVMINALLRGLTPILPPLIGFIGQLASILAAGLAKAIAALLPPLTTLALVALKAIAETLPIVLPLFIDLTNILTAAFIRVVQDLAVALNFLITKIPPSLLRDIALGFAAIWLAIKAGGLVATVTNPVLLIAAAVALLIVGIVELATHWNQVWTNIKNWTGDAWRFLDNVFHNGIVQALLGIWSLGLIPLATHWKAVWDAMQTVASNFWAWLSQTFGTDIANFFTRTLPSWWNDSIGYLKTQFITPFQNDLSAAWNWVVNNVWNPLKNLVTNELPGWFSAGVNAVGRVWGGIQSAVSKPIHFVAHNVLEPLFNGIDTITNFVGLGKPLGSAVNFLNGLALGGLVGGRGGPTEDDQLRLLSAGEAVVPAHLVRAGFLSHLRGLIPGLAQGGFINPIGLNLTPERIDMGVDYGGNGPLFALGSGVITSLFNTGWPGGGFIGLRMDQAPIPNGNYWYYAEDVSPYKIGVGSRVAAGQYIAQATGGPSGIEVGFAAPPGIGNTMASVTGQVKNGNVNNTGWGLAASHLIASLGGRPGIGTGQASTPGIPGGFAGIVQTIGQILAGLGRFATTAIDLAGGNVGGAVSALLGIFKPNAGGAAGEFAQTLLKLPATVVTDVAKWLVSRVAGFVSGRQGVTSSAIGPISGPADAGPGQAQNYARSQLARHGWGIAEFLPLQNLWNRESNWNRFARNPSSGAYGIAQALPPTKYPFSGQAGGGSHASPQIDWGLSYIAGRYGTPAGAWGHETAFNWYNQGGVVREPVIGYGTRSGQGYVFGEKEAELVIPASRAGRGGALIGSVSIQLPEGQTVAGALNDISFWLNVAQQQGYAGVLPGG